MVCKELRACDFGQENTLTEFERLCLDHVKNHFKSEEQRIMCRGPQRKYRDLPS